jgi:hypothetical protein
MTLAYGYKAAKIKANNLEQGLDSKFAQRMMAFCPAGSKRVKKLVEVALDLLVVWNKLKQD